MIERGIGNADDAIEDTDDLNDVRVHVNRIICDVLQRGPHSGIQFKAYIFTKHSITSKDNIPQDITLCTAKYYPESERPDGMIKKELDEDQEEEDIWIRNCLKQ